MSISRDFVSINYHSDPDKVSALNNKIAALSWDHKVHHRDTLGGYSYPILDWVSEQLNGRHYQILKIVRPVEQFQIDTLQEILEDPNTLYAYPHGNKITVIQFEDWDNISKTLSDVGIHVELSPKMFKRLKTLNRNFRAHYRRDEPIKVLLFGDLQHTAYTEFIKSEDAEKLFDGAFIISPDVVAECMKTFDYGTTVFNDDVIFSCDGFNRNTEVGEYYRNSKIFNARLFGPMTAINDGDYTEFLGAIKGQAYLDQAGLCEYYDVDVIAPYSAFKNEVNISTTSFFLLEPQNAKLGQMFSDGQTIVNLPTLYDWHRVRDHLSMYYVDMYEKLTNNKVLDQWADMSFTQFRSDAPKMFDETDVQSISTWNVRAWLACGGKLSDSPWLFRQMGANLLASMRADEKTSLRFPVPCAARALVISESLLRAIRGLYSYGENFFTVSPGTAHWDKGLSVLVVNDLDYVEMYPSHGGCDLDDFFQIYWRTIKGEKKIIIVRSPNDWGEYTIFDYIEGDWHCVTDYVEGERMEFPAISSDPSLWSKRLSEALVDQDIAYVGLPPMPHVDQGNVFNAGYIMASIKATADSSMSVGINVNARQLWSDTMKEHRSTQMCSMEDCIDTGVQGGTDQQVAAVIKDAEQILSQIIESGKPIDTHLWTSKHEMYNTELEPHLAPGNLSYLEKIRKTFATDFRNKCESFANGIVERSDYTVIHKLGQHYIAQAVSMLQSHRRSIALANSGNEKIQPEQWEDINSNLLGVIESYPEGHHRASFVMSLYSACFKFPTSSGYKTDQIVMQPVIFKYLLESLQFYSILGCLIVNHENKLQRSYKAPWVIYDPETNKHLTFENPLDYQNNFFINEAFTEKVMEA